jgi:hypothetical protein
MENEQLVALADEVLDVAERLIGVGERLNEVVKDSDEDAWMASAREELDHLIHAVETNKSVN